VETLLLWLLLELLELLELPMCRQLRPESTGNRNHRSKQKHMNTTEAAMQHMKQNKMENQ
jgi:hypothetical protein